MPKPNNFDFAHFYVRESLDGNEHLLIRPGISLVFYLDETLANSCQAVATLLELVFSSIPQATFRSYLAKDGYYKRLTSRQITKDLGTLRSLPNGYEGYVLSYSEAELAQAGAYALDFRATSPHPLEPTSSNLVRLEFPEDVLHIWGDERFFDFVTEAAQCLPYSSGYCGFAFKRSVREPESMQVIERWLPRYLGFDPSEHWGRKWMKGRMYSPQWITLIGTQFIDKLGGTDRIAPALRGTEVKHLSNGIWVRASRLPPIGDINYFAEDIGQLPTVARLLKPLRTPELRFAYTQLNATKWLERFDDLPATDWDNT